MDIFEKYPDLLNPDFVEDYDFTGSWTVENPKSAMSELDVAVALIRTEGNYTDAAKLLHRSRRSVEGFVTRTLILSDLAQDIVETFLDRVEMAYKGVALMGDGAAARFFLSTKGKARGFTQRSEVGGPNGGPVELEVSPREILSNKLAGITAALGIARDSQQSE